MKTKENRPRQQDDFVAKLFPTQSVWRRRDLSFYKNPYGQVALKKVGHGILLAGDPVLVDQNATIDFFKYLLAEHKDKPIAGYYFSKKVAKESRWDRLKAGTSEIIDLDKFHLQGSEHEDLRRALNKLPKLQLNFDYVEGKESEAFSADIVGLHKRWLKSKPGLPIKFLLGPPKIEDSDLVFFAFDSKGNLQAFLIFCPYDNGQSYYLDHMVRDPYSNKFAMENLLIFAVQRLQQSRVKRVSLGFSAFQEIEVNNLLSALFWLKSKTDLFYSQNGLKHFKTKFATRSLPRYVLFSPDSNPIERISLLVRGTFF